MALKAKNKPTISLCMIVKNEEKFLGQCLESVEDVVDEIVIVDTGSTDSTVEIAKKFTDKIYFHEWEGSFSKARNQAMQYCSCDWILQLDADEAFRREDIPLLLKTVAEGEYDVYFMALMNKTPIGWTKHYFQRLYRRGRARYQGIVHNQLVYKGAAQKTEMVIYHWGYNLSEEEMQKKYIRTGTLLAQQIKKDPANPFAYMNYVRVLKSQRRYEEAVAMGHTALKVARKRMTDDIRQMIHFDSICALIELKRLEEAEKRARALLKEFPKNLDVNYSLGHTLVNQKRFKEAIEAFKGYLVVLEQEKKVPTHSNLIVDTYAFEHRVWAIMADCYYELGQYEEGLHAAETAQQLRPEMALYGITAARHLMALGRHDDAVDRLIHMEKSEEIDDQVYLKHAALCTRYPMLGRAQDILKKGINRFPESMKLLQYYANTMAGQEDGQPEAIWAWTQILESEPQHLQAHMGLVKVALQQHDDEKLARCRPALDDAGMGAVEYSELARVAVQSKEYAFAVEMLEQLVSLKPDALQPLIDLSLCHLELEHYQAALHGFKAVLTAAPGNRQALEGMARLKARLSG